MTIEELKADLKNCRIAIRVKDEEIARLKAEVDKLTFRPEHYLDDDGEWVSNIVFYRMQERLKAEVERLKEDKQQLEARLDFLENPRS